MRNRSPLPYAALRILEYLQQYGLRTQREIMNELNLPSRTVRYAIRRLLEKNFIIKQPNLEDMRSMYYTINSNLNNLNEIKDTEFAQA